MNEVTNFPRKKPFNNEELLEECSKIFTDFVIAGYDKDQNFRAAVTSGLSDGSDVLWLLEMFKSNLLSGVYGEQD